MADRFGDSLQGDAERTPHAQEGLGRPRHRSRPVRVRHRGDPRPARAGRARRRAQPRPGRPVGRPHRARRGRRREPGGARAAGRARVPRRRRRRRVLPRGVRADHRQPGGHRHPADLGQGDQQRARAHPAAHRRAPRGAPRGRRGSTRGPPGLGQAARLHRGRGRVHHRQDAPAEGDAGVHPGPVQGARALRRDGDRRQEPGHRLRLRDAGHPLVGQRPDHRLAATPTCWSASRHAPDADRTPERGRMRRARRLRLPRSS